MTDYVKITDFSAKDALLTGNPAKLVKGTELGAEFDLLATADATNVKASGSTNTVGLVTHAATSKTTPVDADELPLSDSAASYGTKKLTWTNLKATVKAYTDTLYASLAGSGSQTFSASNLTVTEAAAPATPAANTVVIYAKADGLMYSKDDAGTETQMSATTVTTATTKLPTITATVASNALTIGMSSCYLDFRSATLGSGAVSTILSAPSNLVISSGSTLGTTNGILSRIAVLAINNAGTVELAAVNIAGGVDLSETGLISTTAEGGAGAADSASVAYSTTARTNVAYRVVGFVESTQATAGTWATAPSTIQGAGGNAVTAMSSLGYGQKWQNVAGSRAKATTYYNGSRPIQVSVSASNNTNAGYMTLSITSPSGAVSAVTSNGAGGIGFITTIGAATIPPYHSYSIVESLGTSTIVTWAECF